MKKIILSLLLSGFNLVVTAQKTGSFDETITFNSENRTLACYVPNSYDSLKTYQLIIGLHGAGDTGPNYRNALTQNLAWQNLFPQTIFVFPDGGSDQSHDFYTPAGDEAIIQEAMNFVKSQYNIDPNGIVLQGFSLGGRSALKYGLEHNTQFKGLLLNTPAAQGIADVYNDTNLQFGFKYANASQIPIFMTFGSNDYAYKGIDMLLVDTLAEHEAPMYYAEVAGLGHSIPNSTILNKAKDFFNQPALSGTDVNVYKLDVKDFTCSNNQSVAFYVRNTGTDVVTQMDIDYQFNGNRHTYSWNGSLSTFEHERIQLPLVQSDSGLQNLIVTVMNVNQITGDADLTNNSVNNEIYVDVTPKTAPYIEDFESDAYDWNIIETGNPFTWSLNPSVGRASKASIFAYNNLFIFYTMGYEERVVSPTLDLSSSDAPSISFDMAYNYIRYTKPYFDPDLLFADTLIVYISTDCGSTFTELYKKGGRELLTADSAMVNPLSQSQATFMPNSNQWRTEAINLDAFKNEKAAIICFSFKSDQGGCLYIDNFKFDRALGVKRVKKDQQIKLYPNPCTGITHLGFDHLAQRQVQVYNMMGQSVASYFTEGNLDIDASQFPAGQYTIIIIENDQRVVKKLAVAH
ncbi:MAG: T9SS type A sorting domain-containing protein [Bacteroidetes bacterium]|nr:T9SS type A sorting domain-containing protein [Bacteroidota bacterium]